MQSKTYSDLLALIHGLAGVDSFTTAEQTKILAMVNRRLYQAYMASPLWPRYIHAAEARPAPNGVIPYEYDEVAGVRVGSAASRSGTTVTVTCTAAVDFVVGQYVTVSGATFSTTDPNGLYQVTGLDTVTITNDTFTYELASGTGTETYAGTIAVSPAAIDDIEQVLNIWDENPFLTNSARRYNYIADADGYTVVNNYSDLEGFWVGYRARWPGPYASNASDIPLEFFYYAAHAGYADFLRMDDQREAAMAEEAAAQTYLLLEIDKAEHNANTNMVRRIINSHNSKQAR